MILKISIRAKTRTNWNDMMKTSERGRNCEILANLNQMIFYAARSMTI